MKIYVVTTGEYSEYRIDSVFLDKHKAEIYCAKNNVRRDDYRIEEYESDDDEIEGEIDIAWKYEIREGDRNAWGTIVHYSYRCLNEVTESNYRSELTATVYLRAENDEKALKIARDMFAQYKAEKEGL